MGIIENHVEENIITRPVDALFNWGRRSSLWWLEFGLACCGMEMIAKRSGTDAAEAERRADRDRAREEIAPEFPWMDARADIPA